jgi:ribosomal protein S1
VEQEKEELEQQIKAAPLSYKTVQEGMLVLGSIYKINPLNMTISLPGRMSGNVPITSISSSYSKRLQEVVDNQQEENVRATNN